MDKNEDKEDKNQTYDEIFKEVLEEYNYNKYEVTQILLESFFLQLMADKGYSIALKEIGVKKMIRQMVAYFYTYANKLSGEKTVYDLLMIHENLCKNNQQTTSEAVKDFERSLKRQFKFNDNSQDLIMVLYFYIGYMYEIKTEKLC